MKKILMLGGNHFQVPCIKAVKQMGHYAITCDYLPNNPGHQFADEYHNVSTTDKQAVLKLAQELKIDGIISYASDVSAPTAAYVAEKMGLPGQPYESVEILTHKDLFRDFLTKNGFNVPLARGYSNLEEAKKDWELFKKPVMVKPTDSSGSKGVVKVETLEELEKTVEYALSFSRCKRFIIEEYIEKYGYQIAGDGFSVDGKLVFRCFANEHFSLTAGSPYVPIGESWPYNMPAHVHQKLHDEIQRALTLLNMKTGAYNFDARIDSDENVYLMEIGPRNGGNLIAQVTDYATGVNMVEYTIKASIGENCSHIQMMPPKGFWSCYMVHAEKDGIYQSVEFSEEFKNKNLVEFEMMVKAGDKITAFDNGAGTIGTMILKYDSMDEMLYKMDHMTEFVKVLVK